MQNKMLLTTRLDQRLMMNQQLTQAISMLQSPTIEIKQLLMQYLDNSFLLEIDDYENADTDDKSSDSNSDNNNEDEIVETAPNLKNRSNADTNGYNLIENYSTPITIQQHLLNQITLYKLTEAQFNIADAIIYGIDDSGYLTMSLDELAQSINSSDATADEIANVLTIIQSLEPVGIAARDLQECLTLQIKELKTANQIAYNHAKIILNEHFDLLSKSKLNIICKKMNISRSALTEAINIIRKLNPKPASKYLNDNNHHIEPELVVRKSGTQWQVFLTDSVLTKVKINKEYQHLIVQNKDDSNFNSLNKELQEVQWLLKSIQHRNKTLIDVANYIVNKQQAFFNAGPAFLQPLNIIEVAEHLKLHESTVSRITSGKFLACPLGIFELKYFFPVYIQSESGSITSDTAVKEFIKAIIKSEPKNKPYSDDTIADMLKEKGINIARRTVAKYRIALKILPSFQRLYE